VRLGEFPLECRDATLLRCRQVERNHLLLIDRADETVGAIARLVLAYKQHLTDLYNLNVQSIQAGEYEHNFTTQDETWRKNPEFCCSINKVQPLDEVKKLYSVWVSGLMDWQSDHRSSLDIFEDRGGILKFYPLLDVSKEEREQYISENKLPFHPLVAKGYQSIGCKHCTVPGEDRTGRWNNHPKTECGLHL
jgi:phosphoadenosine phosphosulfate reductase